MRVRLSNRMVAGALETVVVMGTMLFTVFLWIMVIAPAEGLSHTARNTVGVTQYMDSGA